MRNWKLASAIATVAIGLIGALATDARANGWFGSMMGSGMMGPGMMGRGMMGPGGMMGGGSRGMTDRTPMMGGMDQMAEHCNQMMQGMQNGGRRPNDQWRDRPAPPKN